MDEVFGSENFVSQIVFTKTRSLVSSDFVTTICDYILWYAKDRDLAKEKMQKIFLNRSEDSLASHFENSNGEILTIGEYNLKQQNGETVDEYRPFMSDNLIRRPNPEINFEWQGRKIKGRFRTNQQGIIRALESNRILFTQSGIRYKFFLDDFAVSPLNHLWPDVIGAQNPIYAVQTNDTVIARCLLMTTDPGDLVLDPTCVRKGTKIFSVQDPNPPLSPRKRGEASSSSLSYTQGKESASSQPIEQNEQFPTACGGARGGNPAPIKQQSPHHLRGGWGGST